MKKLFLPLVLLVSSAASGQIGYGTNAASPSAMLDVASTTKGFLLPRMTFAQRNAIPSPADGLMIYQTDNSGTAASGLYVYSAATGSWNAASATGLAGSGLSANSTTGALDLGGTLSQNTTISAGTNQLSVGGADGAPDARVLDVTNTPATGTLTPSLAPVAAAAATLNYGGTEATGLNQGTIVGSHSRTVSTSSDYQAQGALNEAEVTNGGSAGGGVFRATATQSIVTGNGSSASSDDILVGSASAVNFSSGGNWNGVAVDGFTGFSGNNTTGRTAGGAFEGRGGGTEFGVIGTLDNFVYETFLDPSLANMHIGVLAANRNAPALDQFALYGIGAVRLTGLTGLGSGIMTIDATTGDVGEAYSLTDAQVDDDLTINNGTITASPITNSAINGSQIGATTPASAKVTTLNIQNVPVYADNTAALAASLAVGDVYRTATGVLMIVY